jgi:hypothetical protein
MPLETGNYYTHLAGFYEDDMSSWVLSSIHIQQLMVLVPYRYYFYGSWRLHKSKAISLEFPRIGTKNVRRRNRIDY